MTVDLSIYRGEVLLVQDIFTVWPFFMKNFEAEELEKISWSLFPRLSTYIYLSMYLRVPAGPRFLLHVYLLFSHVSFKNTFKHVNDALYLILWFLYCLGFLSIEQILFVIYPSNIIYLI